MSTNPDSLIIACNPGAIAPTVRDAHRDISKDIFSRATILEIKELADGYSFRLPLETHMLHTITEFIANERLCCPFFTFTVVVGDELWLQLSGTQDVKELIKSDILTIIETGNFPTMDDLQTTYDSAATANSTQV